MKKLGALLMVLSVAVGSFAQNAAPAESGSSFGVVIYAEGDVVSIIRDSRRMEYDAFTGELLGVAVYAGDIIQTDPDTYLEIQLLPSRSIVKVAENTSLAVAGVGGNGDGVFDLAYGRLRARVNRLAGNDPFEIRGLGATAGVRGTDFGTDVVADPSSGASVTRIYCFAGEVTVELRDAPEDTQPLHVSADQMLVAETPSPGSAAATESEASAPVAVQALSPAISEYWQAQDFVSEPEDPAEVLARYPSLSAEATSRLGTVPFLEDTAPEPVLEPGPSEPEVPISDTPTESPPAAPTTEIAPIGVAEAVAVAPDSGDVRDPEQQQRLINVTKAAGLTMTGVGLVADAAAATLFFWGDQILPTWPAASDPDILLGVAASGGVLVVGGIVSLLFSARLSR